MKESYEIKCPNCQLGYLDKLNKNDKKNNDLREDFDYWGCDECKYSIEENELRASAN